MNRLFDRFMGPCIYSLPEAKNKVFLTFDDGPHPSCTMDVLNLLEKYNAKATFFLVVDRALQYPKIVEEILRCGHSIGNHSLDHKFHHFFTSDKHMENWIKESQNVFKEKFQINPVGFRSPAGVRTPPLHRALKKLNIPLIHWNIRFFDTVHGLKNEKVTEKLSHAPDGSIILLHDTHETPEFKKDLEFALKILLDQNKILDKII